MRYIENINDINDSFNIESQHPLIDIRKYSDIILGEPFIFEPMSLNFYKISFVKIFNGFLKYGNTEFSGKDGVLYFIAPGQDYSCTSTNKLEGYQIP